MDDQGRRAARLFRRRTPQAWHPWNSPSLAKPTKPKPAAWCDRCGCKLSTYRDDWQRHCLPCTSILVAEGALKVPDFTPEPMPIASAERARQAATSFHDPLILTGAPPRRRLTDAEKAANRKYKLCACGRGYHKTESKGCDACRVDRISAPKGSPQSRVCTCGGPKKHGALLCRTCHWKERDAAWTPRPKGKAA